MRFYQLPDNLEEEISRLEGKIEDVVSGKISHIEFKGIRVPFGVYEQRKDNTYMMRVRCPAGGITPAQLKKTAELSEKYGSGIIHVTTRQEVQIHDVIIDDITDVMKELLTVGLSTRGGGGNTVRNITASVSSGIDSDEVFDVEPHAIALTSLFIAEADSWSLPRKLKIGFSNSPEDTAAATVQDIGFIARTENGKKGFRVYTAGGLGAKPMAAELLHDFIEEKMIYRVALAIKHMFNRLGNRKNKHAARLRFLWEKLGRDKFIELYNEELSALDGEGIPEPELVPVTNSTEDPDLSPAKGTPEGFDLWLERYTSKQRQEGLMSVNVPLMLGDIPAKDAIKLSGFLEKFGKNTLRFSINQNIHIRNFPEKNLGNLFNLISELFPLSADTPLLGNIVACAGASTCKLGLCLSRGAASAISRKIRKSVTGADDAALHRLDINISGCPNSCGRHQVSSLGFFGKTARMDGRAYPAYNVVGGAVIQDGATKLADKVGEVSARDLPDLVADVMKSYLSQSDKFKDFNQYFKKTGRAEISEICRKYSDIPAFDEDRNYYYDWGADDIFSIAGMGRGECSASLFDLIDHDVSLISKNTVIADNSIENSDIKEALYNIVFSSSRMLLITRGIETNDNSEVFTMFIKAFIETGLVDESHRDTVKAAGSGDYDTLLKNRSKVYELADSIMGLYERMDDTLHFPEEAKEAVSITKEIAAGTADKFKDFRGVKCPLNFVKTKLVLETMEAGQVLEIFLDDGEPIENVPRSVEMEGHDILKQQKKEDYWSVIIRKA